MFPPQHFYRFTQSNLLGKKKKNIWQMWLKCLCQHQAFFFPLLQQVRGHILIMRKTVHSYFIWWSFDNLHQPTGWKNGELLLIVPLGFRVQMLVWKLQKLLHCCFEELQDRGHFFFFFMHGKWGIFIMLLALMAFLRGNNAGIDYCKGIESVTF